MNKKGTKKEMNEEEMGNIAWKILGYLKNKKSSESIKTWKALTENQRKQKMGQIRKFTGLSLEELEIFYNRLLPEIFRKSSVLMSEEVLGKISLKILSYMVNAEGISIPPRNQKQRELGNVAKKTGVSREKLNDFYVKFFAEEVRKIFRN